MTYTLLNVGTESSIDKYLNWMMLQKKHRKKMAITNPSFGKRPK